MFCTARKNSRRAKRRRTPTACTLHQRKSMCVLPLQLDPFCRVPMLHSLPVSALLVLRLMTSLCAWLSAANAQAGRRDHRVWREAEHSSRARGPEQGGAGEGAAVPRCNARFVQQFWLRDEIRGKVATSAPPRARYSCLAWAHFCNVFMRECMHVCMCASYATCPLTQTRSVVVPQLYSPSHHWRGRASDQSREAVQ